MYKSISTVAQQLAQAATDFARNTTGQVPGSVAVGLSENTLVITLHGALSPAEKAPARSPTGAVHVQEVHRQLFANACDPLRQAINRTTGLEVRGAIAEVEPATDTVVQVFLPAGSVPTGSRSEGERPGEDQEGRPHGKQADVTAGIERCCHENTRPGRASEPTGQLAQR